MVALQVSQDTQLKRSARGWDNARLITEVLDSFAASAPQHLRLVFKIHPLERGDDNDRKLIDELSVNLSIIVIAELSSATAISSIMMISRRCGSALQRLDLESRPFRPDFCFRWQVVSLPFL
ncbi:MULTISPECIES: capsular polysaccharide export protein, LipB/KpsS family [Brucella/Ochrobactrum group]|uniref:capsular polysaccharide export protein, LipB/KpsS family n=1 Tax=Brucella sp. NBRC 113783 TaxID=3075478 RepID=UPI003341F94E